MFKLLIVGTLLSLAFSCGKAPKNTSKKKTGDETIMPGLETDLILELDVQSNNASTAQYKIQEYGWAKIPKYIFLKSGTPQHYTVRVYFNSLGQNSLLTTGGELYCDYITTKKVGESDYNQHFDGCYDAELGQRTNHDPFNENNNNSVAIDKDKYIKLEYLDGFASSGDYSIFTEIAIQVN